ncbi:MAG TPA: hypothetical protein VKT51_11950 [Candidatus Eremiobacteraceae bacterium]|nr:hypothetical protein [Candidatus Eremiobacteraceae bacterium]
MNRLIFVLAVLPAAFVLAGCSHAGGSGAASTAANVIELAHEPTTTFKVTYRPDLVQVDHASAAQSIVAISPDGSTFVLDHAPASVLNASPGTTLLLAGFALCKIVSVETNGEFALVQTTPAALTDAISDGTIAWDHAITFGASGQISDDSPARWTAAEPALADTSGPVTVNHTGTANGWQYTTQTTVGENQLAINETLTREFPGGMQITMQAKGTFSNFNSSADIEISNGQVVKFTYVNKNLTGTIDFRWTATKSQPGVGTLPKEDRFVSLPPLVSIPLDLEGMPFTLNIDSAMLVEPGFTAANEASQAHFTVNFSGDQGFSVANGVTTRVGALKDTVEIDPATNAISPIAASAFVGALSLPKLELKPGIAPESLQSDNGAFADRAKQLLAQSGYASKLAAQSGLPAGGSYVQLITSSGLMDFGTMDSFIPCQQATMELSLKVGNAAGLGISSADPNETYHLTTWHRINPAVQYCAKGLAANPSGPTSSSTPPTPCDKTITGNAGDFYGVHSGSMMQAFLAKGAHPGVDITHLRDDPVFANLREDVPISDLNSARLLSTKEETGLGIPGTGSATLTDATVIVQPWFPGCTGKGQCPNPSTNSAYGGVVGLAAHYSLGQNESMTVYIEYEHLIAPPYLPRNDAGAYIDNQGNTIGEGDYVTKQLGCTGFGSAMTNGAKLSVDQLRDHPLIGYLGATEHPHVHIQTAFSLGRKGYLNSKFFDPGIVLVHT